MKQSEFLDRLSLVFISLTIGAPLGAIAFSLDVLCVLAVIVICFTCYVVLSFMALKAKMKND